MRVKGEGFNLHALLLLRAYIGNITPVITCEKD